MGTYFSNKSFFLFRAFLTGRTFLTGLVLVWAGLVYSPAGAQQETPPAQQDAPVEEITQEEEDSQQQLVNALLSLSESLQARRERLDALTVEFGALEDDIDKTAQEAEIEGLGEEIVQAEQEIDLVVLGLQARQYTIDGTVTEKTELKDEVAKIFEPIIQSLKRATEPARRMEELRLLAEQAESRITVADLTLENLNIYRSAETEYPAEVQERLDRYLEIWAERLQESENLALALDEQLANAKRAQGNSFKQFSQDFGNFIINRGTSLFLALGLGIGFLLLCQGIHMIAAYYYRRSHDGVLSAAMRVFAMMLSIIGVVGGFMIAITIFNIRHDWLMLAMSLLLGLGISWTFVRSLHSLLEQARVLLNLGAIREGERTVINGIPYKIERLSVYSKFYNPVLKGGNLIYPVHELLGMHSRPVIKGEVWFPTEIGDWIVRDGHHYQVMDQTPEHVILQKPGGAEDFVPVAEFLGTLFEVITNGYCAKYRFGLDYKHLSDAREIIPKKISAAVKARVEKELGKGAIIAIDTRFIAMGDSSLLFDVMVDLGPGYGKHWRRMQKYINCAVADMCLENTWTIPFPQLVIHKGA
ncbi:MAG: hypothetical protein COA69_10675 [Robiginitomaculum sp.]|nr:MAG: hypothetical protein COA69_10675 [Robiginitomaculum sp.]